MVIDEAVELAKTLSTDESPRFVNGILARLKRDNIPAPPDEVETPGAESAQAEVAEAETDGAEAAEAETPQAGPDPTT